MNKICLISDLHFGAKKGSEAFLNSQLKFFNEQMIPYLKENGIKDLFVLGDANDNRNHSNVFIMNEVFKFFSETLADFNVRVLLGNHDIYHKTSVTVNSLKFLTALPNVKLIEDITLDEDILSRTGKKILMVPWIVDETDFKNRVANKNLGCEYCFGHFELTGFSLNQHTICEEGLSPSFIFDNYDRIFSGHFHKRSLKRNGEKFIQYIGSPYQITRNDINEERGFTIINLDDDTQEFVANTKSMKFIQIKYPQPFDKDIIEGNNIDILIDYDENYNETHVQKYIKILEKFNPAFPPTIKIENKLFAQAEVNFEAQSIESLLKEYVDTLSIENKQEVYTALIELYKAEK